MASSTQVQPEHKTIRKAFVDYSPALLAATLAEALIAFAIALAKPEAVWAGWLGLGCFVAVCVIALAAGLLRGEGSDVS